MRVLVLHPTLFPYTTLFRSVMRVDKRYQKDILTDSTASLVTEGLLGNRYVNITRGFTGTPIGDAGVRSEEHTSELQSLRHLVCRLLLEKKKNHTISIAPHTS